MPQSTATKPDPEPSVAVAVVGLSCRFAGDASSPAAFWDLLKDGRDAYSPTTDRYHADAFSHPSKLHKRQNVIPTNGGYFLRQDPYEFDAGFFNITAAEAMALDPKQRLALEVAYEAIESSGLSLPEVSGTQTACFMGSAMSDYREAVGRDFAQYPRYHLLGTSEEMISNRISHSFDLHGPSATVQTACSSSHVATHLACQSLRTGESDLAIAGGVGLILSPESTMHLNNLGFLSPSGHSKTFDTDASGYGRGEGCGVLLLKRLEDAERDGDTIRAVIRASGVNSDGWTQGVTMPSAKAQADLIQAVYQRAGLDYAGTQYVEAHGTGTKAGDPIEVRAIYDTIGFGARERATTQQSTGTERSSRNHPLLIGSVKPNIGHLEAAAGVASIIKGILAMENGFVPPNIHLTTINPAIPLEKWNMAVARQLTPWPACQQKRMSVSGFGMGGTNAHLILEEHRRANVPLKSTLANGTRTNGTLPTRAASTKKRVFVCSSHDQAGFRRTGSLLASHLGQVGPAASAPDYLASLAHTLAVARSHLKWRATCIATHVSELRTKLQDTLGDGAVRPADTVPRIGLVFTGQGAQWAGMGVDMLSRSVFAASVEQSSKLLKDMGCEWDAVTELSREASESRLNQPGLSQPICTVLQIALVDELLSWGVVPCRVVGHSSGEIAAAYTLGSLSRRDAIAVAYFRGEVSEKIAKQRQGGMMAVGSSLQDAQQTIKSRGAQENVTVACVNSPESVTLSGDVTQLEQLREEYTAKGVFARRLKVDIAYHSPHMHACTASYGAAIADIDPKPATNRDGSATPPVMLSSVAGEAVVAELLGSSYWLRNLISPVLFSDALHALVSECDEETGAMVNAVDMVIEVGPHGALAGPVSQTLAHHGVTNIKYQSMMTRGQDSVEKTLELAALLYQAGVPLDFAQVNDDKATSYKLLTSLPAYAWNHSTAFRADSRAQRQLVAQAFTRQSLLGRIQPTMEENQWLWRGLVRIDDEPWLRDHVVGGAVLFPGAGMVSLALEAARQMVVPGKHAHSFKLRDVSFSAAMMLSEGLATEIITQFRPHLLATTGTTPAEWWEFTVSSCVGNEGHLRTNCRGLITITYSEQRSEHMIHEDHEAVAQSVEEYRSTRKAYPEPCPTESFYTRMATTAFEYGTAFRGVQNCRPGHGKATFDVRLTDIGETISTGKLDRPFLIHAAALDAVFQGWLGSTRLQGDPNRPIDEFGIDKPMLPVGIGELQIAADIPADVGTVTPNVCQSRQYGFDEWSADVTTLDSDLTNVLIRISDFRMKMVDSEERGQSEVTDDHTAQDVDPTAVTSEITWNFALDLLEPADMLPMLANATEGLLDFTKLAIHRNPAARLVELIKSGQDLNETALARLPKDAILPTQARYALTGDAESEHRPQHSSRFEQFVLGSADGAEAPAGSTDILLISSQTSHELGDALDNGLLRLAALASSNDGAILLVASRGGLASHHPLLAAKGFKLYQSVRSGDEHLSIYSLPGQNALAHPGKPQSNGDTAKSTVVVLVRHDPSPKAHSFALALQATLHERSYDVVIQSWPSTKEADGEFIGQGSQYISLLEIEQPFLADLSELDFHRLRHFTLSVERLLWITGGVAPEFSLVDGFSRVMNSENAGSRFQVLHVANLEAGASVAARIMDCQDCVDNEYREIDGLPQVARIHRSSHEDGLVRTHYYDTVRKGPLCSRDLDETLARPALGLAIGKPGLLDTLRFVRAEDIPTLGEHEVELQVMATGMNFRDVMGAMGLIVVTGLGQEASGVVLRTGSAASKLFQPGDRICTLTLGGTHANKTICDSRVGQHIPDGMTWEDAAAIPVVQTTAYYALVRIARLRPGQSVLIHAAAGGVGQAAVQLAIHLGLVVYATAGTSDKRQLITDKYGVPQDNVFTSRDASFVQGIRRRTNGRGVDCVLNSLSGELLRQSWSCLATFGVFVEIGLRDITDNMRLDMRPFAKSTTFTFLNMHTLLKEYPETLGEVLKETLQLLSKGVLSTPHPLSIYPVSQIHDAFRAMQQGKHRGKMVLSFHDSDPQVPILFAAKDSLVLDPTAAYLIVGGLGGLGRSLAKVLVASGARHLAFISRSGADKPEAQQVIEELAARGTKVRAYKSDTADDVSFSKAMSQAEKDLPRIKGVIQMAMVLRDIVFEKMTYDDWLGPLRPKVQGTKNLHDYFDASRPLDFFILCSSTAGVCGNPSQAQYAAGNTYQDALAYHRRELGLKAVSINLGIMRDVGVLAETGKHSLKAWEEILGIREPVFHALMKSLINGQRRQFDASNDRAAQVSIGLGTSDLLAGHGLPELAYFKDPRFGPLTVRSVSVESAGDSSAGSGASLASRLANASKTQQDPTKIITEALAQKIAEILRIPQSEVDPRRAMYQYGVDSLVALEVRNWIIRDLQANLPLVEILAAVPMETFAAQIAKRSKLVQS